MVSEGKQVVKRDGRLVLFDESKIKSAVLKAFVDVDGEASEQANQIADEIAAHIADVDKKMTVEEIQDMVVNDLMASSRKDVAARYVIYRNDRTRVREMHSELKKKVRSKLAAKDVENSNANMDEKSFGGRIGAASDEVMKEMALNEYMSEMARNNHLNNEIYIHDLNHYAIGDHNCLSIPFDKLLANGFNTRQTDVRPAQSINTAFQLVAVIMQLQSLQQFGGVSATHLDWTMVPYVRKSFYKHYKTGMKYINNVDYDNEEYQAYKTNADVSIEDERFTADKKVYEYALDMTKQELYQAVEGLYHNLNTLQSRSGAQLPFSSVNYGTCTLPEGRMVTKAMLEVSIHGIGKLHRTSIFPCGIFQSAEGINRKEGDPNYDLFRLALRSTAQRLYPNYANIDWSGNAGYDKNDPRTYFSTIDQTCGVM